MSEALLVTQEDDVRWLRLNRPQRRNALNPALVDALDEAVEEAMADPGTAVVVLTGTGSSFCAGADLFHLYALAERGADPLPFLTGIAECFDRIERGAKPVVARVHGHAVAGGLELALACDVVVAEAGTLIGDGHVRNGLVPAGGSSVRLPRKVGQPLAQWLILSGELLPAERFTDSGFVHGIAGRDQLDELTSSVVDALRGSAGAAQRFGKGLLNGQREPAQRSEAEREREVFAANWQAGDVPRRLAAFIANGTERKEPA